MAWNIRKMSFIIGAGFSKNISNRYMSWWELMQDIVKEMYDKDIAFHNMSVDDIIKKVGYLEIASEYVRRKGYHEAIEDYIEKRTPVLVDNNNGGHNLELNGRTIEYNVDTSIHKALLDRKNYTKETRKAIYGLTKLIPTLALAMVIFNYRGALSSKVFNRWLESVPFGILGSKILLPAVSMLSAHSKSLKEMTFSLIEHSSLLWNSGIELDADGKVSSVYGGIDTLYIDTIEEYVTLPTEVAKNIYGTLNIRLEEIEKAIGRGFYDQMNEYWCLVLVSIYCFLIRHKNDLKDENDNNEMRRRCHKLYTDICGYDSVLGKLTSSDAYQVRYAVSELELLIRVDGVKNHMTEISYLIFHIADKSCATVYNGLLLIIKLIKKHPDIFRKEGLREGLILMLNNYKSYFNGSDSESWDINARKEVIERMLMHISKYLTEIGYPVHTWDNYKPEFWINEKLEQ